LKIANACYLAATSKNFFITLCLAAFWFIYHHAGVRMEPEDGRTLKEFKAPVG
jgi:hypothetical protein